MSVEVPSKKHAADEDLKLDKAGAHNDLDKRLSAMAKRDSSLAVAPKSGFNSSFS